MMQGNTQKTAAPQPTVGSAFTSIKDALAKSISLTCEYPDPKDSSVKTTTYIKNGKVRVTTSAKTGGENVIVDGNTFYSWKEGAKTGTMMKFDINAMKDAADKMKATISPKQMQPNQKDAMINQMEQYKNYCKQGTVENSYFVVPTDIKFTDYSSMMQKGVPNQQDVQKMMEQYKPTATPAQ